MVNEWFITQTSTQTNIQNKQTRAQTQHTNINILYKQAYKRKPQTYKCKHTN